MAPSLARRGVARPLETVEPSSCHRRIQRVQRVGSRAAAGLLLTPIFVGVVAFGCSAAKKHAAAPSSLAATTTATSARLPDVRVTAASLPSLRHMIRVRGFYVANLLGDLPATLAVARSAGSRPYPPGTLLQLVPQEAMVKHRRGFNAATNDWEFFTLDVSSHGTRIVTRGVQNVVNRFGGNCASCHSAAQAKFDFVCEHDHGCAPLPVGDNVIEAIQRADPRP
jgi:hypothetical protein